MEKRKICFVVSRPETARAFFKLPMKKLMTDFDIYLAANINEEKEVEELPLKGFMSIPIKRRPDIFSDLKSLWLLYKFFKKEHFYVVHSMSSKASLLTSLAGYFASCPHRIRTFTGQIWCNMTGWKRFFYKSIDRLTVILNTELLADGKPQARYLESQKIAKPSQITVLGNGSICGIDIERFHFNLDTRNRVRKELNIKDKVVFIFLGRLKKEKGIKELISAYNTIYTKCPNSVLLLVGRDEENCQSWIKDYNNLIIGKNIIFYGFTPKPNDLLMSGDVFCNPSYREGFGLSVLEASCLGLPVICSDIYGMEDTFINGQTGLRCKVKDTQTLATCMQTLYFDKEMRMSLGRNGHDRVVNYFSSELVTNAWYNFYKHLS